MTQAYKVIPITDEAGKPCVDIARPWLVVRVSDGAWLARCNTEDRAHQAMARRIRKEAAKCGGLLAVAVAAVLALASPARADMHPLTIEVAREFAANNMAPMVQDVEQLAQCKPAFPMPADMTAADMAAASAQGLHLGAYWLRKYDAQIARCLEAK